MPLRGASGTGAYDEGWLQDLLYRHPDSLPIMEINPSFAGLIPICRELSTPAGPLDVLYVTPTGRLVILEAKLWRNPEARRKVIGQILDYAKELSHWTYETLDAAVMAARRRDKEAAQSLFELVKQKHADLDQALFFDSISRSLRRGDLLLLIAGDGIRENVGAITNFIEDHGTLHFSFGLVEMAIYQMSDGSHLVQPRVLAHSEVIRRIVVDVRGGKIADADAESEEAELDSVSRPDLEEQRDLEGQRRMFREFWEEWLEKYPLDDKSQPVNRPTTWTNQFFAMPKGSGGRICAVAGNKGGKVGVYINFPRQPVSDQIFDSLLADKDAIEKDIGQPIELKRDEKNQWVTIWHTLGAPLLPKHKAEAQKWLGDMVNFFVNAFRPRITAALRDVEQS